MGFDDGSYNELPYAREIAALCGTEHMRERSTPDVVELFDRLIVHLDEPFADVSLFPTFLVSQMAQAHVKVVLTGDGGDELFGGYDAYEAQALAARWPACCRTPPSARPTSCSSACGHPRRRRGSSTRRSASSTVWCTRPKRFAQYRWMTFLSTDVKRRLYT